MLLPAKTEVARHLRRYRMWERAMLARPDDRGVRSTFEDSGYTLCVLMGKRCAREAADAAERYLRTPLVTYLRDLSAGTERPAAPQRRPPGPAAGDGAPHPRRTVGPSGENQDPGRAAARPRAQWR
ncbi:DUF5133 domain-containing protein [Streptomyces thermogriseus]|jgi:hypothetical protein|uniref:DUF5133 domain-containing protein n=1 Tax=Streptomyces thermogriseus TaxID=75292 RepID=A0ABP4DNW8_9ACTN